MPTIEFTEEAVHVQRMYQIGNRDLTLRLFDGNNDPLRDGGGRVMLGNSRWGDSDDPSVSEAATRWVGIVSYATDPVPTCGPVPGTGGRVLAAGGYNGTGHVQGFLAGRIAAELAATGTSPQADLYAPVRGAGR